jgi:hypothetical protein
MQRFYILRAIAVRMPSNHQTARSNFLLRGAPLFSEKFITQDLEAFVFQ